MCPCSTTSSRTSTSAGGCSSTGPDSAWSIRRRVTPTCSRQRCSGSWRRYPTTGPSRSTAPAERRPCSRTWSELVAGLLPRCWGGCLSDPDLLRSARRPYGVGEGVRDTSGPFDEGPGAVGGRADLDGLRPTRAVEVGEVTGRDLLPALLLGHITGQGSVLE